VGTGGTEARPAIRFRDRRLAALVVGRFGIEMRRRGLEEITALEPQTLEAR
jgi:hypothetical protein